LACLAIFLWTRFHAPGTRPQTRITFSHFIADVKAGRVMSVTISGNEVEGIYKGSENGLRTFVPSNYPQLYDLLEEKGVNTDITDAASGNWVGVLVNSIPFLLLLGFWLYMMGQMKNWNKPGGGAGKTGA
jgi:cell division protease FtsH